MTRRTYLTTFRCEYRNQIGPVSKVTWGQGELSTLAANNTTLPPSIQCLLVLPYEKTSTTYKPSPAIRRYVDTNCSAA